MYQRPACLHFAWGWLVKYSIPRYTGWSFKSTEVANLHTNQWTMVACIKSITNACCRGGMITDTSCLPGSVIQHAASTVWLCAESKKIHLFALAWRHSEEHYIPIRLSPLRYSHNVSYSWQQRLIVQNCHSGSLTKYSHVDGSVSDSRNLLFRSPWTGIW